MKAQNMRTSGLIRCISTGGKLRERPLKEMVQALGETLSAMTNAGGGTVLLGAEAEGDPSGIYFDERADHMLIRKLEESAAPPLQFKVSREEVKGVPLLKFIISPSPVPCVSSGPF